jgi:diadenosine tetraphosphatase ApaH/serine/threonine PP2A family protein phosphatase
MRVGIFSDVHANFEALSATMDKYREQGVDRLVNLGDTVGYGASPNQCCDIVREAVSVAVLGNHDAAVVGRMDYAFYYEACRHVLDSHSAALTEPNRAWLAALPYEKREGDICYCHGSPLNLEEFDYIFSIEQAQSCLPYYDDLAAVTFIGHSHLCKAFALSRTEVHAVVATKFQVRPDHKYIIGVGSVGQPRDYDNRASYTIFDTETRNFEYLRVAYDIETSARKIFESNLERNFGNRLFLGV